jgi:hypothetical protein
VFVPRFEQRASPTEIWNYQLGLHVSGLNQLCFHYFSRTLVYMELMRPELETVVSRGIEYVVFYLHSIHLRM